MTVRRVPESRRILSWKVDSTFDPTTTAEILLAASQEAGHDQPMSLTDRGVETRRLRPTPFDSQDVDVDTLLVA